MFLLLSNKKPAFAKIAEGRLAVQAPFAGEAPLAG